MTRRPKNGAKSLKKLEERYVSDLLRQESITTEARSFRLEAVPLVIAAVFLVVVGLAVSSQAFVGGSGISIPALLIVAAVFGGYMALNIGANDVANNMGPAVGGKVITLGWAVVLAGICEAAGALLAGGDVVSTVAKGIIQPDDNLSIDSFVFIMMSALIAAAIWINLATVLNAPVSTTHSIVGGVLGGGVAAAGLGVVNWPMMGNIAASWVISPVLGGIVAALMLGLIKYLILYRNDKIAAARRWVPLMIGLMSAVFVGYMSMKGLKRVWKPEIDVVLLTSLATFAVVTLMAVPYIRVIARGLRNKKKDVARLFHLPLIMGAALLSFAHGANDVANAVGPLAAITSALLDPGAVGAKVGIPLWVMLIGAGGIALGLALFGPKLIRTVGEKITRMNAIRAYCVAISAAITVLIATSMGLPVSSTHIAVGAIFGVGFLREFLENPKRKRGRRKSLLHDTPEAALKQPQIRQKRKLVRRRFVLSIAAAWVVTVPASALLSGLVYVVLSSL
ncbi:MAG: inorganic phosphate transporter [Parvibaculaceae bacterium]|nr:inorganic phosphate transporter [Parvibaculaceae bacterium]